MARPDYAALIEAAIAAQKVAYAPYSHFAVGAAALSGSGRIFQGANIENASFSLTICAERIALFRAWMEGERDIVAIAVITPTSDVASPCGACRQVMMELAPRADVILLSRDGAQQRTSTAGLLPHGFGAAQLSEVGGGQ